MSELVELEYPLKKEFRNIPDLLSTNLNLVFESSPLNFRSDGISWWLGRKNRCNQKPSELIGVKQKLGKTLQSWVSPGKSNSLKSKGEVCSTKSPENDIPSSKSVKISYQDRKKLGRWSFRAVVDQLRAVNLSTSRLLLIDKSWCANHFLASEGKF